MNPTNRIVTYVYDAKLNRTKNIFPDGTESEWSAMSKPSPYLEFLKKQEPDERISGTIVTYTYDAKGFRGNDLP